VLRKHLFVSALHDINAIKRVKCFPATARHSLLNDLAQPRVPLKQTDRLNKNRYHLLAI